MVSFGFPISYIGQNVYINDFNEFSNLLPNLESLLKDLRYSANELEKSTLLLTRTGMQIRAIIIEANAMANNIGIKVPSATIFLTSSTCHPKRFFKQWSDALMPFHEHRS